MPLVWGIVRPVIVLPVASRPWSAARLRTVLLHELIHVQRRDLLAQVMAQAACCLYWFHPLAWIAAREQRRNANAPATTPCCGRGIDARSMPDIWWTWCAASRWRRRPWPRRAISRAGSARCSIAGAIVRPGPGLAMAVSLLAVVLIVPMVSMSSYAKPSIPPMRRSDSHVLRRFRCFRRRLLYTAVRSADPRPGDGGCRTPRRRASSATRRRCARRRHLDPSGARIPGAQIHLRNLDGSNEETAVANQAGEFTFAAIPPGPVRSRGSSRRASRLLKKQAVVSAGRMARADAGLELGEIMRNRHGEGSGRPAAAAPRHSPYRRSAFPIGGNVQSSKLVSQPRPVYPADLQQQGVTGTVIIRAVVGKDGQLLNPHVINTDVHPGLAKAALDAVGKWLYTPTLLNGQPVEVYQHSDRRSNWTSRH